MMRRRLLPIILIVMLMGMRAGFGGPTLTGIAIDGNMGDWAGVLANPANVVLDGPAGGLADADLPAAAKLDIDKVAFTWDATYLYVYVHRQASSGEFNYFWFHFDLNNDGRVADNSPLLSVGWWGTNRKTDATLDVYRAANAALGDPITNGAGSHDGYKLPGTRAAGAALESLNGGSATGLEVECRIAWAVLGVPAGTAFQFHASTTRRANEYPGTISDNAGRSTAYAGVMLDPDRSIAVVAGGSVVAAHVVTDTGNIADTFDLTWSAAGSFAPASVTFYRDADASGTLTAGDTPLADTDGDGQVDTGAIAGLGGSTAVLAVAAVPGSATNGQVCTLTLRARSSKDLTVSDTAVDTITIGGPSLTLVKAVDKASAPPGGVLTYTISYSNTGATDAVAVDIVDAVPATTVYVAGSASGAGMTITYSHDGGSVYDSSEGAPVTNVRWVRAAPLPAGGAGSVTFQAAVR